MLCLTTLVGCTVAEPMSFAYERGQPTDESNVRIHQMAVDEVKGKLHIYATFQMGDDNPISPHDGQARGRQLIMLGQEKDGTFVQVVEFGLQDNPDLAGSFITPYLYDQTHRYYGRYARPRTPYDFNIELDTRQMRITVRVSGRGDDHWYILAEDAPITVKQVTSINAMRIEQHAGAAGIDGVVVLDRPWEPGAGIRPHPRAKSGVTVGPGRGFTFQSMRSLWHAPGRHVTVARVPDAHHAFTDVALAGPDHLVCTYNNKSHTAGENSLSVVHSYDGGRSWGRPELITEGEGGCPRIQRLKDGTLLMSGEAAMNASFLRSRDEGRTWTDLRWLDSVASGGRGASCPSRVLEMGDGSWLVGTLYFPKDSEATEILQIFRSTDEGRSWQLISEPTTWPPFNASEQTMLTLGDGRLVLYAREVRSDGFPGLVGYSTDNGRSWDMHELPFAIVGRTCADFLDDGRVMLTFRTAVGQTGLWAWIGEPGDRTPYRAAGAHINDRHSVGLKGGALHIDSDGVRGQLTTYFLRQPDSKATTIDVTVELQVVANEGRAATLSVPYVGKFRLFPDRVEWVHEGVADPVWTEAVDPGHFHTYRVVRRSGEPGAVQVYIDGKQVLDTDRMDEREIDAGWASPNFSFYRLGFGNEPETRWAMVNDNEISPLVTGYSIWRRAEVHLDDPKTGAYRAAWSARSDGFPDQYQLDHIIEIEGSALGNDQGYSGWVQLDDGQIFVANYTDDTAPMVKKTKPGHPWPWLGIPWIRGTFVLPSDLLRGSTRHSDGH